MESKAPSSDRVVGNLNGYLLEPVNASYGISNKYYFDEEIRKELYGNAATTSFRLKKKLYEFLRTQLEKKGYDAAVKGLDEML